MATLQILRYPDPRLHTVAKPVLEVDARIRQLVDDMLESMYAADGVGLAATQVDVHERVIVMDTSDARDDPRVLINPEIVARSEEMTLADEGCLSVPGLWFACERPQYAKVVGTDLDGKQVIVEGEDIWARLINHEVDHLNGKLYIDRLAKEERRRAMKELRAQIEA